MPSPLMALPPWVLVSPSGLPHLVLDEHDLQRLPHRSLEVEDGQLDELRKLIGLRVEKKGATKLPLHKKH